MPLTRFYKLLMLIQAVILDYLIVNLVLFWGVQDNLFLMHFPSELIAIAVLIYLFRSVLSLSVRKISYNKLILYTDIRRD